MSYTTFIDNYLFICDKTSLDPCISHTIIHYLNETKKNMNLLFETDSQCKLEEAVNPYEYLFSKVPNFKNSVSKISPFSNTFYELMEISSTLHLFLQYEEKNITSIHVGRNSIATIECMNFLREDKKDRNITLNDIDFKNSANTIEFIYYELEKDVYNSHNDYISGMTTILCNLLYLQKTKGIAIIKVADIYYKPIVEILYLISIFYEKVYIIKPSVSNILTNEKYIVCKSFIGDLGKMIDCYQKLNHILELYEKNKKEDSVIQSFIKNEIPYNFICKLEESNIIMGQQQLESYDQIVHILKMKNKEERIELLCKNNIQKCIHWCEKYRIPYHKFNEKPSNLFNSISGSFSDTPVNEYVVQNILDNIIHNITVDVESLEYDENIDINYEKIDKSISMSHFPIFGMTPASSSQELYDMEDC